MRFIRQLLERKAPFAWILVPSLATGGVVASCASEDEGPSGVVDDAGAEGTVSLDDAAAFDDASSRPDGASHRDAAPFDGGPRSVVCHSAPCAVSLVRAFNGSALAEGYCALLDDGAVACWGAGTYLGRGPDDIADSATAKRVVGLPEIARLYPSCAIDKSGGVWCWGYGPFLAEGSFWMTGENAPVKLPLPPARSIAVNDNDGCALVDEDVLCWGRNPTGVVAPAPRTGYPGQPPQRVDVGSGAPIRDLHVGAAGLAVREDGVTLSWGANPPLGRISSLGPDTNPMPIPLEGISSLDLAEDNACATAGGVGYCWGNANVSISPPFVRLVPEPVATPEPIVQIATTRSVSTTWLSDSFERPQRWCAVGASGNVYCWGYNASGQAGDGTKNHAYQAVKVEGLPEEAVQVSAFADSTCALLTNGKVYCWGTNAYGQLGNGRIHQPSLVPEEVVFP